MLYGTEAMSGTVQGGLSNGLDFCSYLQQGSGARGRSGRARLSRTWWGCDGSFISRDFCKAEVCSMPGRSQSGLLRAQVCCGR